MVAPPSVFCAKAGAQSDHRAAAMAGSSPRVMEAASSVGMIGRSRELGILSERLARDRPVVVCGEAGVGKTTLLRQAVAGSGRPLFEGGGLGSVSWVPHLALRRALGRDLPEDADEATLAAFVVRTVGDGVLVLDDLQWTDAATRALLPRLAGRAGLLCAVRLGDAGSTAALGEAVAAGCYEVGLAGLDDDGALALAGRLLPHAATPELRRLVERSGGNPLFLEELARSPDEPSPDLARVLRGRLRALSEDARDAMCLLALLGRPAPLGLLDREALAELAAAGLVALDGDTVGPRHTLLAEAAVATRDGPGRADLHGQLAARLDDPGEVARHLAAAGDAAAALPLALRAAEAASTPGERAAHLALAASCASGEDAGRLRVDAAASLLAAGEFAAAAGTATGATSDAAVGGEARLLLARALCQIGRRSEAGGVLDAAFAAAGPGDVRLEIEILLERARVNVGGWDPAALLGAARQAHERSRAAGVALQRADLMLGTAAVLNGDPAGIAHLRSALSATAAEGDAETAYTAAFDLVFVFFILARQDEGRALIADMVARSRAAGHLGWEQRFRSSLLHFDVVRGDYGRVAEEAEALLAEPVDLFVAARAECGLDVALLDTGLGPGLRPRLERLGRLEAGAEFSRELCAWTRAEIQLWTGVAEEALRTADEALARNDPFSPYADLIRLTRAHACVELGRDPGPEPETTSYPVLDAVPTDVAAVRCLLDAARPDEAPERFDDAAARWQGRFLRYELVARWGAAESLRRRGDTGAGVARLLDLTADVERTGLRFLLGRINRSLRAAGVPRPPPAEPRVGGLTAREGHVLDLVAEGLTNKQIARFLGLSPRTVDAHMRAVHAKLGTTTRIQAASLSRRGERPGPPS